MAGANKREELGYREVSVCSETPPPPHVVSSSLAYYSLRVAYRIQELHLRQIGPGPRHKSRRKHLLQLRLHPIY